MSRIWAHDWLVKALRTLTEFLQHPYRTGIVSLFTYLWAQGIWGSIGPCPHLWSEEEARCFLQPSCVPCIPLWGDCSSLLAISLLCGSGNPYFIFSCLPHHPCKVLPSPRSQARASWQEHIYFEDIKIKKHFKEEVTHYTNSFKEIKFRKEWEA